MAYLILDLDETVMQAQGSSIFVNPGHLSSNRFIWRQSLTDFETDSYNLSHIQVELVILNPLQLSQLISAAINYHDGVIILTSGLWSPTILKAIAEQLDLA